MAENGAGAAVDSPGAILYAAGQNINESFHMREETDGHDP